MQLGFTPHDLGDQIYNGHVVCVVEERRILDLTHGIELGPSVCGPLPQDFAMPHWTGRSLSRPFVTRLVASLR